MIDELGFSIKDMLYLAVLGVFSISTYIATIKSNVNKIKSLQQKSEEIENENKKLNKAINDVSQELAILKKFDETIDQSLADFKSDMKIQLGTLNEQNRDILQAVSKLSGIVEAKMS